MVPTAAPRPPAAHGISRTRTELSEHPFFSRNRPISHIHAFVVAGCKIARELLQLVAGSPHAGCALNRGSPAIAKPSSQRSRANQYRHQERTMRPYVRAPAARAGEAFAPPAYCNRSF